MQNVGAYGQEVAQTIWSVRAYDRHERRIRTFANADCRFEYRHSRFKGSDRYVDPVLRKLYQASFSSKDVDNIKWYPAVPAGLEEIEGNVLEKVRAAASR